MSSDRYYLTSDDIRQQQKINRAVVEGAGAALIVNRRRTPADPPADPWHCDITEGEDGSVSVKVIVRSSADDYFSVTFRGQSYRVDSEIFTLSSGDLDQDVYIYLVKVLYSPFRFYLAPSHTGDIDSFSAGCVQIATITRQNGEVIASMQHDRLFEWLDDYPVPGKFTADLVFTGIIHNDDEPEPIPFYDFLETAEQKLLIWDNYAMMINGLYFLGTVLREYDTSTSYSLISIRPEGHETDALQVFWTASITYTDGNFGLSDIHYELICNEEYPYRIHGGVIRIPIVSLTAVTQSNPVRRIDHTRGAPNIPELSVNPFGQDADAELSSWVYIDQRSQTVRLAIQFSQDGSIPATRTISIPFTAFASANRSALSIRCYYNINSHTWTDVWFALDGTPITTKPTSSGGYDDKGQYVDLAYISYNAANGCPYVVGQNITRVVQFSSAVWRFAEFAGQIGALDQRVTALEQRNN